MHTNKQKFIKKYKKLEVLLNKIKGNMDTNSISSIIEGLKNIPLYKEIINQYKDELKLILDLRNLLSHSDHDTYIDEVSESSIALIEKLYKILNNPPMVEKIMAHPVAYLDLNQPIEQATKYILKNLYSHIPVYDEECSFKGVISEINLLSIFESGKYKEEIQIKNYLKEINKKKFKQHNKILFLSLKNNIFEVQKKFNEAINQKERLGAIFITKTGNKNEKPLGVITAHDLYKIKNIV